MKLNYRKKNEILKGGLFRMSSINDNWKIFLKEILENGEKHEKDDGDVLQESLINHCFIDNPLKQFTGQNINSKLFLNMIKQGVFDIKEYPIKGSALAEYVESLDDESMIYGTDFVYTYPERLCGYYTIDRFGEEITVNQLEIMEYRLLEHEGSNRAVATLYNCGFDATEQHIPCLQVVQATIRNNKLILHVFFRSNDCYSAFPSNMLFISYIGIKLTESLKEKYPLLEFEGINYNSSSLHIYKGDLDAAKKVIGL